MAQQIMPNAKAYSPPTTLNGGITSGATQITVTDVTVFPAASFMAVITGASNANFNSWDPADYETVLVGEVDGSILKQVTRGVEGTAQAWADGSYISCVFTAEAYKRLKENIEDLDSAKVSLSGGTLTGILYPQNNTSYTTGQARRIVLSTDDPSGGGNGDVWIKYEA